jgi:hypothetical protein
MSLNNISIAYQKIREILLISESEITGNIMEDLRTLRKLRVKECLHGKKILMKMEIP